MNRNVLRKIAKQKHGKYVMKRPGRGPGLCINFITFPALRDDIYVNFYVSCDRKQSGVIVMCVARSWI